MPIPPSIAAEHRLRIARILHNGKLSERGKKQALWNYILTFEVTSGSQFLVTPEKNLYMVSGTTNQIIPLPDSGRGGDQWFAYFTTLYGMTRREENATWLYDVLRAYVIDQGSRVELRRFSVYNQETKTAYLSTYDGRMYRIEGENAITVINNGDDGVFFADDDPGERCDPDIGHHGELIERLTELNFAPAGLSGISPEQQKMALIIWVFALAFPDVMPTKPILLLEGTKGSGKSAAMVLIQLALMGKQRAMILQRNKEDDFGVVLLRSPIALFDNTDSYIDWVPDAVCAYATTGQWVKRALYTNDDEYVLHPHAMIAVASKNPASFRRDDTADRCLVLRLQRRETFRAFSRLKRDILNDRPRLFGEYLWYVGKMVTEFRAEGFEEHDETHRMADFAAIGRVVGRVLGWEESDVAGLMDALQKERDAFISEEDPLAEVLEKWVDYKSRFAPANRGRTVTLFELHAELQTLAQASGTVFKESTRTLMQKLRSTHIERDFHIEEGSEKSQRTYRIWRASDPRLEVVS